jgi:hypothetical protein
VSKEKARLTQLASRLRVSEMGKPESRKKDFSKKEIRNSEISKIKANPAHGEKGDFRKVTVTLPPEAYRLLVEESARRKIAGDPNHLLASIVREAVVSHLKSKLI